MKWEESKRWQKRVDSLRAKLTEKNKELEAAMKQTSALKEMLARYTFTYRFLYTRRVRVPLNMWCLGAGILSVWVCFLQSRY